MRPLLLLAAFLVLLSGCASVRSSKTAKKDPPPAASAPGPSFAERLQAFEGMADAARGAADGGSPGAFSLLIRAAEAYHRPPVDYTPAQEYFLGRTTAANLLVSSPPAGEAAANRYLNLLGQSLARYAADPEVWQGYRFQIVESDEINSFSAPGGFVFITRGLLRVVADEDQLASVLAHEIAHIELHHGVRVIQKDRQMAAVQQVFADQRAATGRVSSEESKEFAETTRGLRTWTDNSVARGFETEADAEAVDILDRAGYPPQALLKMLQTLEQVAPPTKGGWDRTHLNPAQRIRNLKDDVGWKRAYTVTSAQKRRFQAALGRI